MPQAIILNTLGGPDQLEITSVPRERPQNTEISIQQSAIGVNYIDTYFREGLYGTELPAIIGDQAVGTVIEVGTDITDFSVGDKIAYASVFGSYQETRCINSNRAVKIPAGIPDEVVAATLTRGLTAEYLLFRLHALQASETIIIHAAAGGTGSIMCQWARAVGATIIGTVGDESKVSIAKEHGCDHVLIHSDTNFITKVLELTDGKLVDVVYDSIGKDTFETSVQCLKARGLMVAYGNASGKPEPIEVLSLARLGSIYLTRPILSHYIGTRAEYMAATERYFRAIEDQIIELPEITRFKLSEAPQAHRHLEDRTKHSIPLLVP